MKVSINGLGNIGTTLTLILNRYSAILGITEIYGYKNNPLPWQKTELALFEKLGVKITNGQQVALEAHAKSVDFVFDTTENGIGLKNKSIYESSNNLKGAIAQGSENGFGIQYMSGLPVNLQDQKFVQIVSCNTHAAASLLSLFGSHKLQNIQSADFVVIRRSEDIGQHTRLVGANVVARHLSDKIGTHHGIDVKSMYKPLGIHCPITSSDITTPSQLMHATRFHIETKAPIDWQSVDNELNSNPLTATTVKFDSNAIFELGRRYGAFGRIFNHVIVVANNILKTEYSAKGWAFVPQEGNTIVSTIEAFLAMTGHPKRDKIMQQIMADLCPPEW